MIKLKDSKKLPHSGTLHTINQLFHSRYNQRKDELRVHMLNGDYQLVVRMDDRIIAKWGEEEYEYNVVGDSYHNIKAAAHLPLLLLYAEETEEVLHFVNTLKNERNTPFVQKLSIVLEHGARNAAHCKLVNMSELKTALTPILAEAMDEAAKEEISKTVKSLDDIKMKLPLPLDKTFFIIFGSHQARYKQLGKMIIKKWFENQTDCYGHVEHHVRYCENGENIEDAYDIVCTALADNELAHVFLGEQYALNQDVVTQTAEQHLNQFWPNE